MLNRWNLPHGWKWSALDKVAAVDSIVADDQVITKFQEYVGLENIEKDTGSLLGMTKISEDGISNKFVFGKKHILYGKLRPYLNKVFLPDFEGVCSTDILTIKPNDKLIDRSFLAYWLRHPIFVEMANARSTGANLPRIKPEILLEFDVPVPSLETQRKIVAILDKAEETKRLRAQSNEQTQKLLQSVFLEIFGDPVKNEKKWPTNNLSELVNGKGSISCGPFGSQLKIGEYVERGLPVLGIDNIEKDRFVWAKHKQITQNKAEELSQFQVIPGDLLISRTGTVGRACIVPENLSDAIIGPNLLKVRFNRNKMEPEYFSMAINFIPSVIDEIAKISPGATVAVLNTTNLKRLRIAVPDVSVQRDFISIKEKIERVRTSQRESFTQVDQLSKDLVRKAFSGELVA